MIESEKNKGKGKTERKRESEKGIYKYIKTDGRNWKLFLKVQKYIKNTVCKKFVSDRDEVKKI